MESWGILIQLVSILVPIGAAGAAILGIWLENRMYKANDVLLTKINGTYVRTILFDAKLAPIQEDIREIQTDLNLVWTRLDANK